MMRNTSDVILKFFIRYNSQYLDIFHLVAQSWSTKGTFPWFKSYVTYSNMSIVSLIHWTRNYY